jgi:hypothetical protein
MVGPFRIDRRLAYWRLRATLGFCLGAAFAPISDAEASTQANVESGACVLPVEIPDGRTATEFSELYDIGGQVLVHSESWWFSFDSLSRKLVPLPNADAGRWDKVHPLLGGGLLVVGERGWYRLDAISRKSIRVVKMKPSWKKNRPFVVNFHDLPGGAVLVRAEGEWFLFKPGSEEALPVGGKDPGIVYQEHDVTGGGLLMAGQTGWFRFDPSLRKIVHASTTQTGEIYDMHWLQDGGILMQTERGWFWQSRVSPELFPAGVAGTEAYSSMHDIPGGEVLIRTNRTLFRLDVTSHQIVSIAKSITGVMDVIGLPKGGVLIRAENGWFRFDAGLRQLVPSGKAEKFSSYKSSSYGYITRILPGGGVLIHSEREWLYFDPASHEVMPVSPPETGSVLFDYTLGAGLLIIAERGLFWFDPSTREVIPTNTPDTGDIRKVHTLAGGGALIITAGGVFHFDEASHKMEAVGYANMGNVSDVLDLPGDGILINGFEGWFRFDLALHRLLPAGNIGMRPVISTRNLPGGWLLIDTGINLLKVPPVPLSGAIIEPLSKFDEWVPQNEARQIQVRFHHPCALMAEEMALLMTVSRQGDKKTAKQSSAIRIDWATREADMVTLMGIATFNKPGKWIVEFHQLDALVGEPFTFELGGPTFWERLAAAWQWVVAGLAAVHIMLFAALLWMSHRSLAALRILVDSAWNARLLTWPFFLMRHVPAVQRWVLEPWFQNVRRSMADSRLVYFDPPAWGPHGRVVNASTLLDELSTRRRVWLQGRTGMGKSTVFTAWARAYFGDLDCATLANAARKHGFILVMLPVRHYAAIDPPEPKNPESWVIETIRRRFEQFGVVLEDVGMLKAMLRAGNIAIALDGTNEADRSDAIIAFARQYTQVRIMATSQTDVGEGWDLWRLPADVNEQRAVLLRLWLGNEAGAVLEERLASDQSVAITSGYDLRLVADLAFHNPVGTPLPHGRSGLYRAVLRRATRGDGEPLDLLPLRRLAAKLIVEGRREFSFAEGQDLGEGVAAALSSDGVRVMRRVGRSWEFRHDQMRAFLAASSLAEDTPTLTQLVARIEEEKMLRLRRDDQEALWGFLADLLGDEDVKELWVYAQRNPGQRGLMQAALQRTADRRMIPLVRPAEPAPPIDTSVG